MPASGALTNRSAEYAEASKRLTALAKLLSELGASLKKGDEAAIARADLVASVCESGPKAVDRVRGLIDEIVASRSEVEGERRRAELLIRTRLVEALGAAGISAEIRDDIIIAGGLEL